MLAFLALVALGLVLLVGLPLMFAFAAVGLAIRAVFWLLFLPFRLLGGLFRVTFGLLLLPALIVGGLLFGAVVLIGGILSMLVSFLPLIFVGLVGWGIYRASHHRWQVTSNK